MYTPVCNFWTLQQGAERMTEELLVFNGIDGASGEYLLPSMTPQDVSKIVRGETFDAQHL